MPPDDDDIRASALGAMIGLVAQLDRAPDRTSALVIAREIRKLLAQADEALKQPGDTDELHTMAETARDRLIKAYGTSAWEEPASVSEAARRMGTLSAGMDPPHPAVDTTLPSLTDRQLTDLQEYFEDLPDMEPIDSQTKAEVTSALIELQRLRVQTRKR